MAAASVRLGGQLCGGLLLLLLLLPPPLCWSPSRRFKLHCDEGVRIPDLGRDASASKAVGEDIGARGPSLDTRHRLPKAT